MSALPRPASRSALGQASVEWLACLAVVAVLLGAAAALAGPPTALANAVVGGMRRALCVVMGERCATLGARPCVVSSGRLGAHLSAQAAVVSVGGGAYLLTERRSDGTAAVSLLDERDVGAVFGVGAKGHLEVGTAVELSVEASASAELAARLARRRTWEVPNAREADRMVRVLTRLAAEEQLRRTPVSGFLVGVAADVTGLAVDVREPDRVGLEAGAGATVGVEVTGGTGAEAGLATTLGGSVDRRTGRRTLGFRLEGSATAELRAAVLPGPQVEGDGALAMQVVYDRAGRPLELTVTGSGAGLAVPGVPTPPRQAQGDGRTVSSATLDLTSPGHRAVYDALMGAMDPRHLGALPGAARALAGALDADGRHEVARYRDDEHEYGAGASAALGLELGLDGGVSRSTSSLLDAWDRPPGGLWEQRMDCLAAARA